jgi:signal transduction histidine kinase
MLAAETCEHAVRLGRQDLIPDQLAMLRRVLEQGVGRLRHLMGDLRPYQPQAGGLEAALQAPFRSFTSRNNGAVSLTQDLDRPLSNRAETLVYRLILETLWTVQDLNEPTTVNLALTARGDVLHLRARFQPLRDVPPAELLAVKRVALLRWRVQALGGTVTQSAPEPGQSELLIRLPLSPSA